MKKRFSDSDLIALNTVGLSTMTIGKIFSVNQSAVTARLKKLNMPSFYQRGKSRTFMEDIFFNLSPEEKEYLTSRAMENGIKSYLENLIKEDYAAHTKPTGSPEGSQELSAE